MMLDLFLVTFMWIILGISLFISVVTAILLVMALVLTHKGNDDYGYVVAKLLFILSISLITYLALPSSEFFSKTSKGIQTKILKEYNISDTK